MKNGNSYRNGQPRTDDKDLRELNNYPSLVIFISESN